MKPSPLTPYPWLLIPTPSGLPVNFADDSVAPSFAEYASVLRTRVPALFEANKM